MKKRIKLITALLSLFLFVFTACENPFVTFFEDVESEAEEASSDAKKLAYIRLMVVEPGAQVSESMYASRPIVAAVSSSAFSDITFNGTKTDGSATIPQVSAANFTELGQQEITLLTGTWNFSLEAYLGKTASFPGEKYVASLTNKEIVEGSNQLRMRLEIDPASYANPGDAALHPGSWSATLTIPATSNIDTIKVYLFNYAEYVQSGVNLTTLKASAPYSVTLVRGTDFTSTTATAGESSRAMGNYIVYIEYYKNVSQQAGELAASGQTTVGQQLLSTWGEFMRINPGASSQGTIELSDTDQVYSIVYSMPDADGDGTDEVVPWNTSSTDAVPLFYTQRSGGAAGVITLPPASALNLPTGYTFAGWYKDSSYNDGPYTQFNVTDAENKSFYAKFNSPYVYELYISASPDGDDISGDGSRAHPYASLRKALESFPNATLTDPNSGEFGNTVYILSDYTITQGCNTGNLVYANIVGRKGGIAGERVTFVCQTPSPNGSAFYVQNSQKIKMKNIDFCTLGYNGAAINFTTTEFSNANQYAAINITPGTEFTLENSTMEHLVGKDVSAISVDGKCTLKNVAIKNNFTVNTKPEDQNPWGCSVFVKQGELHVSGATSVIQNKLYSSATSYIDDSGVWIGHSDGSATGTYYHPIVVDSELTGSIVVTPYNYPGPGPTPVTIAQAASGYTEFNAVTAKTKFVNNNSDYNINSYTGNVVALFNNITTNPNTFYVSGSDVSPAGASEAAGGDGSSLHPFDTLQAALDAIATENDSSVEYTIHVSGTVNGNTSISTVSAAKLYIEGVSSASSILSGNDTAQVLNIQGGAYPIDITNLTIQHGNSENGGGIYIHGYNSLQPAVTISNCVIKSNTATNGAGLYVDNGAFVTITDTEISGNTGAYGGGIAVTGDSIINLGDGVAVKGNTGGTNGGGIYISSGTVCMYDSAVVGEVGTGVAGSASDAHSNSSIQGGGIYVNGGASNKAYLKLGYEATQSGTFTETTLTGGVYRNYSSGSGGGIYLYSTNTTDPSSVIFKTGNIVGNAAVSNGGGIYVIDKIELSLYGGTISGNESVNGGAIAVNKSSNYSQYVKLKDGISIPAGTEQKNDIYINTEKNCKLTIDGNLTATESLLITPKTYTENAPILIDGTGAVADNYTKFAVKDEPTGSSWRISNTGLLVPQGSDSIPLTLEAVSSAATVSFQNKASGPVTYKVNGGAAVEIASGTTGTIELAAAGDKVEFYGNNAAYGVSASSNSSKISCTADCYVYGNIMSLINSSSYGDLTELTQTYTFAYLFVGNSKIKNKTGANLLLPATTLANYCYYQMFNGCTGLTAAPELPATTLAAYCYEYMFKGCIGLTAAPELPATTLANHCYRYMFYGCTGFTSAPELPATTLANYCYENMFKDCTGLTSAPELPAATLASYCYQSMFYGCTGLTSAPELPATTLANYCYNQMFNGCTGLTSAPELPATTLADYCYQHMFDGCTNLHSVTCLATNISASDCVTNWLYGVASTGTFTKAPTMTDWPLNSASGIPSGWTVQDKPVPLTLEAVSGAATVTFTNKASGPVTYKVNGGSAVEIASGTTGTIELAAAGDKVEFYGNNAAYGESTSSNSSKISCTADCYVYGNIMSLINSSSYEDLTELTQTHTFTYLFYNNSKIKNKTGANLLIPATTLADYCYKSMFQGCTGLTTAPELPATTLANGCYSGMFYGCTGLTAAPELPATTLAVSCYYDMFNGCTGLTAAPELPATTLATYCYRNMFNGCTGLTAAPELPATTLAANCYLKMFNGCTGLTAAPALPATTLATDCYKSMFQGCTQLTSAPELPATTLATYCYQNMFYGCTGLTAAPELPATTLATYCYQNMFNGCTNLNSVTCLATDISASSCVENWLSGVASTGTFTKAPAMTDWPLNSASGIPSGWTAQDKPVPLTLEAVSGAATVTFTNKASGPVTYKVNGGAAVEIASGTTETITLAAAGDKVEFFGDNAKYGASTSADCSKIECSAYCYVYGNIMSLVDSDDFASADTLTEDYTFAELFYNNSWIMKKTNSALRLSATTLTNYCYYFMFEGCTSLAAAPELPATTLANKCYSGMFFGCTNLAAAPALTATTLAESCYSYMFNGCTGLTAAPVLSVTTLAAKCYQYMFKGCTNLATAPALPATTLADYCYNNMFNGCTSITTAPELPATTLKNACYSNMFEGCTNLATAPALPATTLASTCYNCMFKGCTSLTAAPELPATTLTTYCYKAMFEGCTNLNSVTCLATSISATDCTLDWLSNVASAGVFTKASDADWSIKTGASGIPSGWTISGGVTLENVTLTSASFNGSTTTGSTVVFTTGRNLGTIKSLIVSDHETTQGEYELYCKYGGTAPSDDYGDGEYYPAYNVSWYDAIIYCNLRSIHDGYNEVYSVGGITDPTHWTGIVGNSTSGYCAPSSCAWDVVIDDSKNGWRLPYEAEWEYIWREKNLTGTGQHTYCGGENINDLSWNDSNSLSSSHIVKTKDPNSLDIYDMCGNVWEWMNDWHSYPVPASAPITGVAYVNADPQAHVTRGGGWRSDPTDLTATRARNNSDNNARANDLGFRVVRNAETTTTAYPKDSGYVGTKAPDDTKAVGDIVFNDGSAMAYADFTGLSTAVKNEKKKKAIALIFYKGTGLNSGSDTSERTLGVGIKNLVYVSTIVGIEDPADTLAWCTTDAKAYNVSISSIKCEVSGSGSDITFTGDKDGSDNLEQIAEFLNNQSLENDTGVGVNSTKTPGEAAALYPAFYFAKNYKNQLIGSETSSRILTGSDFEDGWYFPSVAEVQYIYKNGIAASKVFDLNAANQALGGTSFIGSNEYNEYGYASSTQDGTNNTYSRLKFTTLSPYAGAAGSKMSIAKTSTSDCICAIREF